MCTSSPKAGRLQTLQEPRFQFESEDWKRPVFLLNKVFPNGSAGKESTCNAGDIGGNGNPLQYSCLENPMDRGTWRATVHGITKS